MRRVFVLAAVLAVSTAQPFATFGSGDEGPPFLRQPATVGPTNAPTTTPAPVTQGTAAPSIVPAAAPAPSIQPQNNATSQTSAGNTSSIASNGFIRAFGTYFVDSQCRNFVPVCLAAWFLLCHASIVRRCCLLSVFRSPCQVGWNRYKTPQCSSGLMSLLGCSFVFVEAIRRDVEWGWRWPNW